MATDLLHRLEPEQAYRSAFQDVRSRVSQAVRKAFRSDPAFLTESGHVGKLAEIMAPIVQAGQLQVADLTNAHLSSLFGVKHPPAPSLSGFARQGVDPATELARPFWSAVKMAQAPGKTTEDALAFGEARLIKMVQTDLQMAKVRQAQEVLRAGGIEHYARVAGPNACWLCSIAATQVYNTGDLAAIHPGCGCDVVPVPDGGAKVLAQTFNPAAVLADSGDQVKLMGSLVENEAPLADYQDKLAIREHGETGPTLTWAHQKFTTSRDGGTGRSPGPVEHAAFEAVQKTGGVTIDMAGNMPKEGYAYAPFKGTELVVPQGEFTTGHIDRYIDAHATELAQAGNHLGMWTQDGNIYLDISKVGAADAETLAKAQRASQLAVYDLSKGNEITLGEIDHAGKYTALGSPADLHAQHREQVARADEARSASGVPGLAGRAAATVEQATAKASEVVAASEAQAKSVVHARKVKPPRVGAGGKFTAPHDLGKNMPTGRGAGTDFLDHDKMVVNILARYQDCLKPENMWIVDAGKSWYPKAGEWLDWLIQDSGFTGTRERAAAIAAAFSENTAWSQNMLKAENFFRGFKITEGSPGLNTARRVMAAAGDPVEALHSNDIHWKTVNFARAILGDPNAVAIDRWAARVAMGTEDSEAAKLVTGRRGAYDKFAEAYRDAAKQLGLKPSELQAITWVHAVPPDATVRYFRATGSWGWAK